MQCNPSRYIRYYYDDCFICLRTKFNTKKLCNSSIIIKRIHAKYLNLKKKTIWIYCTLFVYYIFLCIVFSV